MPQPTITVRLRGGLGNQLFQYAAAFAVAQHHAATLLLDTSFLLLDNERRYELGALSISARLATPEELLAIHQNVGRVASFVHPAPAATRLRLRVNRLLLRRRFHYLHDHERGFQPELFDRTGDLYLAGTWASEKYFADQRPALLREFTPRHPPAPHTANLLAQIQQSPSLCVHVRRGDYVTKPDHAARFGTCLPDYYLRAAAHLTQIPALHAYLFSDDPAWANDNIRLPFPTTLIPYDPSAPPTDDFRLMTACQHFIIANSTLSWWAAWLATHPEKIIIAPQQWSRDPSVPDPVPPGWLRA